MMVSVIGCEQSRRSYLLEVGLHLQPEDALMCLVNAHIIEMPHIHGQDAIRGLIFRATLRILEIGARQAMVALWGKRPVPLIDDEIWSDYFSA
jgi:hypothetical protein